MTKRIKHWWRGFITAGTYLHQSNKDYRLLVFLNVGLAGSSVILAAAALLNLWFHGVYRALGAYELVCALTLLGTLLFLRRTKKTDLTAILTTIQCGIILLLLMPMSQGLNLVGAWLLIFPVVAFLLLGHRRGMVAIVFFLIGFGCMAYIHSGDWLAIEYRFLAWTNLAGVGILISLFASHSERARAETASAMEVLANKDALTELANRRFFLEQFETEVERSVRHNHHLSLLVLDVDHFKQINDHYGHEAGDWALVQVAQTARRILRKQDVIGRLGGEEFGVLLPETDIADARAVAEKLRLAVEQTPIQYGDETFSLTVSIGVAEMIGQKKEDAALFATADLRLYEAKRNGRNRVVST